MPELDPSQFYTGIVAQIYAPLRSMVPDPEPYARFVTRHGEPALELGCGDGDPLLDLRARGLDVEGLDSSADMLERCRAAAQQRGLDVVLHHQPMESMAIDRRFRTIYIAGPTFNLLPDDAAAQRALRAIAAHLTTDGVALVPLFVPEPTPPTLFGRAREHVTDDGATMRFSVLSESRDEAERTQMTMTRYEIVEYDVSKREERAWLLHWYPDAVFRALVDEAGLTVASHRTYDGRPATRDDTAVTYVLTRDDVAT